jgi:hypothetical protein
MGWLVEQLGTNSQSLQSRGKREPYLGKLLNPSRSVRHCNRGLVNFKSQRNKFKSYKHSQWPTGFKRDLEFFPERVI